MRRLPPLTLSDEDREQLERWARGYGSLARTVIRARIVLLAAQGCSGQEVGRRLGVSPACAGRWRRRFELFGLLGIAQDAPRLGRPPVVAGRVRQAIARRRHRRSSVKIREPSARSLARRLGVSHATVLRARNAARSPQPASHGRRTATGALLGLYRDGPLELAALSGIGADRAIAAYSGGHRLSGPDRAPRPRAGTPHDRELRVRPSREQSLAVLTFLRRVDDQIASGDVALVVGPRRVALDPRVARWLGTRPYVRWTAGDGSWAAAGRGVAGRLLPAGVPPRGLPQLVRGRGPVTPGPARYSWIRPPLRGAPAERVVRRGMVEPIGSDAEPS